MFSDNVLLELYSADFICCFVKKLKCDELIVSLSKKQLMQVIAMAGHFCTPPFRLPSLKRNIS